MLTENTQKAIEIIHELAFYQSQSCPERVTENRCAPNCLVLLEKLRRADIIRLLPGKEPMKAQSYELCRDLSAITLYDVLIAINEGINLLSPSSDEERIYKHYHYGKGAIKLGVVNQMLRTMLCEINMIDL